MGIIHRDISDGNVMLLPPGNKFTRREWKEQPGSDSKKLSVSEEKLQGFLTQWDRDPTGMLTDFDLHARLSPDHSFTPKAESVSDLLSSDTEEDANTDIAVSPGTKRTRGGHDAPAPKRRKIDTAHVPADPHKKGKPKSPSSEKVDYRMVSPSSPQFALQADSWIGHNVVHVEACA
jgi:hypothetical protein